jgi:hypothetical protein
MAFRPGCHDVRTRPTYAARAGYYRLVRRSHARSTPEHEVPISAQSVYENLRDKSSCRARFHDHFQRLIVLWFFAQRKCPIHFRKFPVSTALPQRFCKNCQTSVLFRLAPINFHLRLHGKRSAYGLPMRPNSKVILPYQPGYTGHWEMKKRRKETKESLRQREQELRDRLNSTSIVPGHGMSGTTKP